MFLDLISSRIRVDPRYICPRFTVNPRKTSRRRNSYFRKYPPDPRSCISVKVTQPFIQAETVKPGKRDKSLSIRYAAPSIARDPPNFHSILVDRGKTRARDFRLPGISRGFGTPRLSPVHAIPIRRAAIRSLLPRSHVARNRAISSRHAATRR